MKKQYIVFFLFVSLGIAAIIMNFYFAKQNLKEIAKEEAESNLLSSGISVAIGGIPKKDAGMRHKEQAGSTRENYLKRSADEHGRTPEDYIKKEAEDLKREAPAEGSVASEEIAPVLEPTGEEMKELGAKGVIFQ